MQPVRSPSALEQVKVLRGEELHGGALLLDTPSFFLLDAKIFMSWDPFLPNQSAESASGGRHRPVRGVTIFPQHAHLSLIYFPGLEQC